MFVVRVVDNFHYMDEDETYTHGEFTTWAEEKVRDYLINPNHPVGGPKAVWFASIGYTRDNWQDLADDLLQLARTSDDFTAKRSAFGVKYEVSGEIGRLGRRPAMVLSVWIVEKDGLPRLITAYPG